MPVPILIDTDIGSSFDDTICLAYVLASGEFDLVGLSTVSGQSQVRARYARSILNHYGLDVPVVAGNEVSLSGKVMQPQTVDSLPLSPRDGVSGSGPDDLQELYLRGIERYGEQLVILSIGPFTNLARLLGTLGGAAPGKGRPRLVSMGGSVSGEREWNVLLDPVAAGRILGAPPSGPSAFSSRTLLPIETTRRLAMTASEAAGRIPGHLSRPFGDLEAHPRHPGTVVLHDPLAALTVTQPEYCDFQEGSVEISIDNEGETGSCTFAPDDPNNRQPGGVSVAVDVDPEAALNAILSPLR